MRENQFLPKKTYKILHFTYDTSSNSLAILHKVDYKAVISVYDSTGILKNEIPTNINIYNRKETEEQAKQKGNHYEVHSIYGFDYKASFYIILSMKYSFKDGKINHKYDRFVIRGRGRNPGTYEDNIHFLDASKRREICNFSYWDENTAILIQKLDSYHSGPSIAFINVGQSSYFHIYPYFNKITHGGATWYGNYYISGISPEKKFVSINCNAPEHPAESLYILDFSDLNNPKQRLLINYNVEEEDIEEFLDSNKDSIKQFIEYKNEEGDWVIPYIVGVSFMKNKMIVLYQLGVLQEYELDNFQLVREFDFLYKKTKEVAEFDKLHSIDYWWVQGEANFHYINEDIILVKHTRFNHIFIQNMTTQTINCYSCDKYTKYTFGDNYLFYFKNGNLMKVEF